MTPASVDTALRALAFIPPDERDTWIRMGMALKAEFGDDAKTGWLDWSAGYTEFNQTAANASWKSFKSGGKVGIGTLFAEAKAHGFVFEQSDLPVSPEALAKIKRERAERDAKAEADRIKRAKAAANRAQSQWRMAAMTGVSPYLQRKQVEPEGCRFLADGGLIIPMLRYDVEPPLMVGKQLIAADGQKRYSHGMDRAGSGCRLGAEPVDSEPILLSEGYATGLSVRMAIERRHTLFLGFDAGGLLTLAKILRAKYPHSPMLFCGDDDYLTGESGLIKAQAAADAVGLAAVVLPVFTVARRQVRKDESLPMPTDFNDLHVLESLDAVRTQIDAALVVLKNQIETQAAVPADSPMLQSNSVVRKSRITESSEGDPDVPPAWLDVPSIDQTSPAPPSLATVPEVMGFVSLEWALSHCALVQGSTDVWDALNKLRMKRPAFIAMVGKESARFWEGHKERRTISPRNLPKLSRGVAAATGGAGDDNLAMMLDRYTLLYGTKTVWDGDKRVVLSYDAMQLARGGELASRWIAHPLHREIDAENLVFDPSQKLSLDTHVNMFQGFPLKPKKNDELAGLVLALLRSLCSSEPNGDEVFCWVLRWLALPLQKPGAKLQTALLFFGERQGTGKSLFFEGIMRPIYGQHGATAGQHQLDSTFTGWRSQKLYAVFEEILSRADKYSHFGLVKHMITGRDMRINEKNLPERVEANHLNCVMLSNEFQAMPLEPDDRRVMVVEARNPLDPELLADIKGALKNGLIEAFYAFLLDYPLDDFDEHAKPVMTDSKQRVIRFGLPSWDSFYRAWSEGELDAPYCTCLATDLYTVFEKWCTKCGERALSLTKFSELVATRVPKSRQNIALGVGTKKTLTVFKVDTDEGVSISKLCQRFKDLAFSRVDA